MYLEGLSLILEKERDITITGASKNAAHLLQRLPTLEADLLLLDLHLPDSEPEELVKTIRQHHPDLKIIFLTLMRGTRFVHKLIRYNIQGYLLKSASIEELLMAIRSVAAGQPYFSKEIDINPDQDEFRSTILINEKKIEDILTKREVEILKLVCKEYSNAEIAQKLFLSIGTVETHRKNLISKLGVNNTVGLVKFALRNGLIT